MEDSSALVRAMAIWASRRLASDAEIDALRKRYEGREHDAEVAGEWTLPIEELS